MLSPPRTFTRRDATILGAILAVVLGVWIWADWAEPNLYPKNFGVVTEGVLYRSGRLTPAALERIVREHHIRTVVDLGGYDNDPTEHAVIERACSALNLTKYEFRLYGDGTGNPNCYVAALRVIADPANRPVLVHCAAGSERTGGCVLLYHRYIDPRHLPWEDLSGEAFQETLRYKHDPRRSPELRDYLAQHAEEIGEAFEHGTWVEGEGETKPVDMTPSVEAHP